MADKGSKKTVRIRVGQFATKSVPTRIPRRRERARFNGRTKRRNSRLWSGREGLNAISRIGTPVIGETLGMGRPCLGRAIV